MAQQSVGCGFMCFLAGLGVGAVVALFFAPQSGAETREMIAQKACEGRDYAAARGKELRRKAEDVVTEGRRKIEDLTSAGKDLVGRAGFNRAS